MNGRDHADPPDRPLPFDGAAALEQLRQLGHELAGPGAESARRAEVDAALARLEALLQPGEAWLSAEPASPALGYLATDRVGVILEANGTAADLLGVRREFLIGKPLPLLVIEEHRPALYALLGRSLIQAGAVRDWRVQLRRPRGEAVAVSLSMAPIMRRDHTVQLRWLLREPTLSAESALEAERAFADTLLDVAAAVVLVLDERGHIQRCNPYARAVSGQSDGGLVGREWGDALLAPEDRQTARVACHRAARQNLAEDFTASLLPREGPPRAVAWSVRPLRRAEGRVAFVLALGHDITELQEAQRRALEAERLAAIGRVMAVMAHESRNLLQAAAACLERLSWRLEGQPEPLDLIGRAQQAHRGLTLLFEDLRLYAAPLRLEMAECDLAGLWREVWREVHAAYTFREAHLEESGEVPPCRADRFRLGQVIRNLFENSFAGCEGPVHVHVGCAESSRAGRAGVRLSLRDHGSGLNDEQRQRLFEPFFTTRAEGTGLGTTIAKRIVEAHGGQIGVGDATPGLEIVLWLPRDTP